MARPSTHGKANDQEGNNGEGRRSRRLPIPGVLVAIDAPDRGPGHWVADAIDVNAGGIGLVILPELPEGTAVELSFKLADDVELSRVPGVVRHQEGTSGGVQFSPWPEAERLKLLEYLVRRYELGR